MKLRYPTFAALFGLTLLFGAGCTGAATPAENNENSSDEAALPDAYEGWGTISPGDIISLRIPADCTSGAAAGSTYITCSDDADTSKMVLSSDGQSVRVRPGDDRSWDQWNKVVESIKVLAPLDRTVEITIVDPSDTTAE